MAVSFFDKWRRGPSAPSGPSAGQASSAGDDDAEGVAELLSECELLRAQAVDAGIELDGTVASLEALDQLTPRWRDAPGTLSGLGNDAGLYLGTVIVRTVPGARWQVWPDGRPMVRLASGRELDVVEAGEAWAAIGAPELAQVHAEAAEGSGA
ncbi:DUF6278 family protein [Streptomyces sp. RB6PN25]|uniref:DUF6278 family protein n=1 Tax=Streptomyces humicola TaxID=2953240 RepID=A0ABT1Q7A8_9ACTN|nr:DUF6278 family protein [Streptomyces humicola]MCQ4084652.1 DUF6278 family protein [Streptomyces humicola]